MCYNLIKYYFYEHIKHKKSYIISQAIIFWVSPTFHLGYIISYHVAFSIFNKQTSLILPQWPMSLFCNIALILQIFWKCLITSHTSHSLDTTVLCEDDVAHKYIILFTLWYITQCMRYFSKMFMIFTLPPPSQESTSHGWHYADRKWSLSLKLICYKLQTTDMIIRSWWIDILSRISHINYPTNVCVLYSWTKFSIYG